MSGWVKAYRQRFDNPIWRNEPLCRVAAWDWLCARACWKETRFDVQGRTVTLQRGQLCVTVRDLAAEWRWSRGVVERFLTRLKTETMIETTSGTGKATGRTIITICNYEKYQATEGDDAGPDETTSGTTDETTAGQLRDNCGTQKKKDKKDKKDSTARESRGVPLSAEWSLPDEWRDHALSKGLSDLVVRREAEKFKDYWTAGKGKGTERKDWRATWHHWIRKAVERQGQGQSQGQDVPRGFVRVGGMLVRGPRPPQGPGGSH